MNNSEHESGSTFFWQAGGIAGLGGFLIPLGLMFGIMYFLVILPQQRQRKKSAGDAGRREGTAIRSSPPRASTGTINGMDGDTVILKIADNVKFRIARAAIAQWRHPTMRNNSMSRSISRLIS